MVKNNARGLLQAQVVPAGQFTQAGVLHGIGVVDDDLTTSQKRATWWTTPL